MAGGAAEQSFITLQIGRASPREPRLQCRMWTSVMETFVSVQEAKPKHILVFQHIPLYLSNPDEEDDYFNLHSIDRQNLLDRFQRAGRTQMDLYLLAGLCESLANLVCLKALKAAVIQHPKISVIRPTMKDSGCCGLKYLVLMLLS